MARPKKGVTPTDRFWLKVTKTETCWLWTGRTNNSGHGQFDAAKEGMLVHRFSWELHRDPILGDDQVLHTCDVPNCVNPDHLYLGDPAQNALDRQTRNRGRTGLSQDPCPEGHPFNPENFRVRVSTTDGYPFRICLICSRTRDRERWQRRKKHRNEQRRQQRRIQSE